MTPCCWGCGERAETNVLWDSWLNWGRDSRQSRIDRLRGVARPIGGRSRSRQRGRTLDSSSMAGPGAACKGAYVSLSARPFSLSHDSRRARAAKPGLNPWSGTWTYYVHCNFIVHRGYSGQRGGRRGLRGTGSVGGTCRASSVRSGQAGACLLSELVVASPREVLCRSQWSPLQLRVVVRRGERGHLLHPLNCV